MSATAVGTTMGKVATTFPHAQELVLACASLDGLGLRYELISPAPGYELVDAWRVLETIRRY